MRLTRRQLMGGGLGCWAAAMTPARAAATAVAPWPRAMIDALGRRVELPRPPRRIVPVFSSNTEIVAALGAADRIVGIDGLTHEPPEIRDRPVVGNRLGFSADLMARLAADLVIVTPARHAAGLLLRPMAEAGIPVMVVTHRTVAEVIRNIQTVGWMIGAEGVAQVLIDHIQAQLTATATRIRGCPRRRVYFETGANGRGQAFSVRPGSYTDDMLRLAGGDSVFPDLRTVTQVSGEAVATADPDAVVVAGDATTAKAVYQRPRWAEIPAVAAGRVIAVPRRLFLIPGPRIAEGVDALAAQLHGVCATREGRL